MADWFSKLSALSQLDGEFCQPFALCEGDVVFFGGQDGFAVVSGDVGRAVGGAAALGAAEGGFGVGDAADDHAVVQEGEHHGEEGGFLSAVLGGGAGEDGGGFACKFCAEPLGDGAVDEVFHGGCHVAKAGWAAEGKGGAGFEVFGGGVGCAAVGDVFFDGFADGGDFGDGAQYGFAACDAFDAACDLAGKVEGAAVLGVVEDEYFEGIWVHLGIPLQWGWLKIGVWLLKLCFQTTWCVLRRFLFFYF